MARYVAIPKKRRFGSVLSAPSVILDVASRAKRIEMLTNVGREDVRLNPTPSLKKHFSTKRNARILATPRDLMPLSGITVIEGDSYDAAVLQEEYPDHEIVEDFPIQIVAPVAAGSETDGPVDVWHKEAVGLDLARNKGFRGEGEGVTVAVLDTGIEVVPELDGRIAGAWEISGAMKTAKIDSYDTDGHGTGVASLVVGKSVGIAPAARVINVLMMPFQSGGYVDFLTAMEFTGTRAEVSIANISAGIAGWESRILPGIDVLLHSGILPVVAVGNEGRDTSRSPGNYSEVFSVGASNRDGAVWSGSGSEARTIDNKLYTVPDVVAPGQAVTTCGRRGRFQPWSGSSLAAPIVSGIAALINEKYKSIALTDLREEIFGACELLQGVQPLRQGDGLVKIPTQLWFAGS